MEKRKNKTYATLAIFIAIVALRCVISMNFHGPHIFFDEGIYYRLAYHFIRTFNFDIDTTFAHSYPPGYSMIISPATLAEFTETSYKIVLFMNCIMNSLVFLFTYKLLERLDGMEEHRKGNIFFALFVSFIPSVLPYTFVIMSENLYIPLFLAFIILLYDDFERFNRGEDSPKGDMIIGLLLGYLLLTRMQTLIPIIALGIVYIYMLIHTKEYKRIFKKIFFNIIGFTIIVIYPVVSGRTKDVNTINDYGREDYINRFLAIFTSLSGFITGLKLFLSEVNYVFAVTYGVFLILFTSSTIGALKKALKKEDLDSYELLTGFLMLTLIGSIILTVIHMFPEHVSGNRFYDIFGRYLDPFIPPILVLGFVEYRRKDEHGDRRLYYTTFILSIIFTTHFVYDNYKFLNMYGLLYIQQVKRFVSIKIFMFALAFFAMVFTLERVSIKKLIPILTIVAILCSWYPISTQISWGSRVYPVDNIGNFINKQGIVDGNIYIDEDDLIGSPEDDTKMHKSYIPAYHLYNFWSPGVEFEMIPYSRLDKLISDGEEFITSKVLPYEVMYYDTYFKLYDFEKPLVLEPSDIVDHIDMRKVEEKNLKGFYDAEEEGRWVSEQGEVLLEYYNLHEDDIELIIDCHGLRPEGDDAEVEVYINGRKAGEFTKGSGDYTARITVKKGYLKKDTAQILEFRVNTWNPAEIGFSTDNRDLGIQIESIYIEELNK